MYVVFFSGDMCDLSKAPSQMLLIGNPENRRVMMFQDALIRQGYPSAIVVSYLDLLKGHVVLDHLMTPKVTVRIESPGENFEVERELLRLGFNDAESESSASIDPKALQYLAYDYGQILYPRQWFLGFKRFLMSLTEYPVRFMNSPDDIVAMFDKRETHKLCAVAGIPVPPSMDGVLSFDALLAEMKVRDWDRVFVKLAHGSSASGVGALHRLKNGDMRLVTSSEMVRHDDENLILYNSLKIRTYTSHRDIADLINEWCRHGVHVEQWLPKACQDGLPYDLRIVSIGGMPSHSVVRLGQRSPITNLHLGNRRGDFDRLIAQMRPKHLEALHQTCHRVAALFPNSLYFGIDLLPTPHFNRHFVLEVNAFGDLLPNVYFEGSNTYDQEIVTWFARD